MGETTGAIHRATLARAALPVFATPDQAVQGFGYLVRDHQNRQAARELPPSAVLDLAPQRDQVRRCFDDTRSAGRLVLTQDQALDVLVAYGIPTVPTRFAASPSDAAELLGFPVVVKQRETAAPPDRPPASLVFDLHDTAQVIAAAQRISAVAQRQGSTGELLIQRHVTGIPTARPICHR